MTPAEADREINRLCKWRSVYTGRILGTVPKGNPQGDGFRDLFEKLLIQRAEMSALTALLIEKGIISRDEMTSAVGEEAKFLADALETVFPGMKATDDGITYNLAEAIKTMEGWPP